MHELEITSNPSKDRIMETLLFQLHTTGLTDLFYKLINAKESDKIHKLPEFISNHNIQNKLKSIIGGSNSKGIDPLIIFSDTFNVNLHMIKIRNDPDAILRFKVREYCCCSDLTKWICIVCKNGMFHPTGLLQQESNFF